MKILVLGSRGQIGRCLRDQLAKTANKVVYLFREQLDISNFKKTKEKLSEFSPDVVINAAAYTAVDKAEDEEVLANLINHLSVRNLAICCADLNCWLFHFSTDYVFDGFSLVPYAEEDKTNPKSVYGKTKLMGELAIQSSGCKYVIIRTAWVFSEYGNNFMKTMLYLAAERNELKIVGDQVGCPTYAQDIAHAVVVILRDIESGHGSSGLYHFGGNLGCSWADFASSIFDEAAAVKIIGVPPKVVHITTKEFPTRARRPAQSQLNSNKIKKDFGIDASDWGRGIRSSLSARKTETSQASSK